MPQHGCSSTKFTTSDQRPSNSNAPKTEAAFRISLARLSSLFLLQAFIFCRHLIGRARTCAFVDFCITHPDAECFGRSIDFQRDRLHCLSIRRILAWSTPIKPNGTSAFFGCWDLRGRSRARKMPKSGNNLVSQLSKNGNSTAPKVQAQLRAPDSELNVEFPPPRPIDACAEDVILSSRDGGAQ